MDDSSLMIVSKINRTKSLRNEGTDAVKAWVVKDLANSSDDSQLLQRMKYLTNRSD